MITLKAQQDKDKEQREPTVDEAVSETIAATRHDGDRAVTEYSHGLDRWTPASFRLSEDEIEDCVSQAPERTIAGIRFCQDRVWPFARARRDTNFESLFLGEDCARQCHLENFEGHSRTCDIRISKYSSESPA